MMTHGFGKSRFESEASHMRPQLLAIALSLLPSMDDAEDAVQDTLLKLWAVRERIASTSHFRNLAVSVCRNLCLNMLRSMAVRRTDRLEEEMEVVSTDNAQHSMERQEQALRIRAVWNDLPQQHRIIIHMKEVDRLTTREIAALLGTTECNVRTRLSRARKAFMERMGHS